MPPMLKSVPPIYLRWLLESTGLISKSSIVTPATRAGVIFLLLFAGLNVAVASRYQHVCPPVSDDSLDIAPFYAMIAFFSFLLPLRAIMRQLYRTGLFDRVGFVEKFATAAAISLSIAAASFALCWLHELYYAHACALGSPSLPRYAVAGLSGIVAAIVVYVFWRAVFAAPIQNTRLTSDYRAMFELAMRAGAGGGKHNPSRQAPRVRQVGAIPSVGWRLYASFLAQFIIGFKDRLGMALFITACAFAAVAMIGLGQQGNRIGVVISLGVIVVLFAEVFAAPGVIFDRRVVYAGAPFSRKLFFLAAPFAIFACFGWGVSAALVGVKVESMLVLAVAVIVIALRYLMRIVTADAPFQAMRTYLTLAAAAYVGFQLLGPLGLAWLPLTPIYYYQRARRRLEGLS